jgi:hypothetical protein
LANSQSPVSRAHRLLVCAALDEGAKGQECFIEWANMVQLTDIDYASQRVLPAIVHQLSTDDLSKQILKLVKFTRLRSQSFLEAGFRAEASLTEGSIPSAWVAGGAIIANTEIRVSNRTLDDIGLLVPASKVQASARLLQESGFQLLPNIGLVDASLGSDYGSNVLTLRDETGAKLSIYWHSVDGSHSSPSEEALWARVSRVTLLGRKTFSISPEDLLLQVFLTRGGGNQAYWAIDATRILEANEIDFRLLSNISRERRLWLRTQISLTRLALIRPDLTPSVNVFFAPILRIADQLVPGFLSGGLVNEPASSSSKNVH